MIEQRAVYLNNLESHEQSAKRYYRPELDAVRFFAFVLVFIHHTIPADPDQASASILRGRDHVFYAAINACGFGLGLFFTLSAFLICELLMREKNATGTIQGKQFYLRRILRIWPLYYLALVLSVLVAFLLGGPPNSAVNVAWFAVFMTTWLFALHGTEPYFIGHLWSISVEEQFYVFAPWIVKCFSRRSLYAFCGLLILVANVIMFHFGRVQNDGEAPWDNSFVQFQYFACGILLSLFLNGRTPRIASIQRLLLLGGSYCCWLFTSYSMHYPFYSVAKNPGSWRLICALALASIGTVMAILAFLGTNPQMIPRWMIYLGRISYGLYVFHIFALRCVADHLPYIAVADRLPFPHAFRHLFFVLKFVIAFGITVLIAALSYRYFETPFLRLKKRHAIIQSRPV